MIGNPQTDDLLSLLSLPHILTVPYLFAGTAVPPPPPPRSGATHSIHTVTNEHDDGVTYCLDRTPTSSDTVPHYTGVNANVDTDEIQLDGSSDSEPSRTNEGTNDIVVPPSVVDTNGSSSVTEQPIRDKGDCNEIELDLDSDS